MSKFYITTPIYYVNAKPHIGGAYTTVAADILTRFHRMKGEDVFLLTGTDEHGEKNQSSAEEHGLTAKELCDQNAAKFEEVWDTFKISYNRFIRTTDKDHEKLVQKVFKHLQDKDLIYKGEYQGLYCVGCERYFTSKELVNDKCPFHHTKPVKLSEKCYFLKLSCFQQILIELIEKNDWIIEPLARKNEVLGFLRNNKLEDLAVSREKVKWGVLVPGDKSQTIYIWIDALTNYLSGIGWEGELGKWPKHWPPDIQLIGKDILRFHAVIWPAMLLALGAPLPKKLYVHGFFTIEGKKMSKSLGNVIDPEEIAQTFGSDAARWLLFSVFPFGADGDISRSKFYERYKTDLSGGIGNLVRRTVALALKSKQDFYPGEQNKDEFVNEINQVWKNYQKAMNNLEFEKVQLAIKEWVSFLDKIIDQAEPWKLIKSDPTKFYNLIYNLLESLRQLAWLIYPFMPNKAEQIWGQLGILKQEQKKSLTQAQLWGKTEFKKLNQDDPLFPQLQDI